MLHRLYVVGGEERQMNFLDRKTEWPPYHKAIIVEVDLNAKRARRVVEYMSPPEVCASNEIPDVLFKSGTLKGNRFYVCTKTEVLIYNFPEFEKVGYITLPCFNDLHHVCPTDKDTLLVVVTGLDLVIEMTEKGEILREWNVLGEPPWQRFSKSIDYRKVLTTKPHQSHPNYAFQLGNELWVTRFEQRDAICLTDPTLCMNIGIEKPHDGIPYNNHIY
jgi:hypothetical protein